MTPKNLLPMRAVGLAVLVSLALVAIGATGSTTASAGDLEDARARLTELRANLESVADRYVEALDQLVELNSMMEARNRRVQRLAKALLGFEKDAEALAVELYKGGGSVAALEGVLSAQTMADLNRTAALLEFSGEDQQRVIEVLQHDTQELEHELDLMDRQREESQATLAELEDIQEAVETDAAEVQQQIEALEQERAAELAAEREAAEAAAQAAVDTIAANPPPTDAAVPSPSSEADWDAIAMCESGGNWHIDSTYDGGLQFHPNTWLGYGGGRYARYAWQATKEQQIAIAEKVLASQGPGAWPNCFQWK